MGQGKGRAEGEHRRGCQGPVWRLSPAGARGGGLLKPWSDGPAHRAAVKRSSSKAHTSICIPRTPRHSCDLCESEGRSRHGE